MWALRKLLGHINRQGAGKLVWFVYQHDHSSCQQKTAHEYIHHDLFTHFDETQADHFKR